MIVISDILTTQEMDVGYIEAKLKSATLDGELKLGLPVLDVATGVNGENTFEKHGSKAGSGSGPQVVIKEKKKIPGWGFSLIIAIVIAAVVYALIRKAIIDGEKKLDEELKAEQLRK